MTTPHLKTLGHSGLFDESRSTLLLAPGKSLALLIYLALTPGRRISRDFLLDLLWDDLEPERARGALRQALFHLRRLLGEDALPGVEELTLAMPFTIDRDAFLAAIERGELEHALELYGGEFLPAFGVPGGVAFEHWADLERDRLRGAFLRCCELVVRRQLNEGRFRAAQRVARRARQEAPQSEAAWRLVLEAVVSSRDFVSAAVEADALEQWAAQNAVTLEAGSRSLIGAARQLTPRTREVNDSTLIAELTGREREFALITSAWDHARTGSARHVHLVAHAGLGKTRILRDAAARMRANGARVVAVTGNACDQDIPFAFAADLALAPCAVPGAAGIAPAAASTLIALNPALSSYFARVPDHASGENALVRRIHAFADLVHAIADEQPFVLVIDDVHWLDAASLQVLEGMCNRLNNAHVLCLTASRPERSAPGAAATVLPLAPLSEAQVSSLVSALGALPAHASWATSLITGLHAATGGSPLLILETLRLALEKNVLALEEGKWACRDEPRLMALLGAGEALRQRVRALPEAERWLLGVIATIGTAVTAEALADASAMQHDVVTEKLRALQQHGLLIRGATGWSLAHDEIATVAREAIASDERKAHRIAGALLSRTAPDNPTALMRGMRHLVAAGEDALVRQTFRRYALKARELGETRSFSEMAQGVTGPAAADALVSTLPLHWRLGLWSPSRQRAAAAALIVIAVGVGGALYARDAASQRVLYADPERGVNAIRVHARDWDGRSAGLAATHSSSALRSAALSFSELPPAVSPDGKSVAWVQQSGDSTTLDIWIRTRSGTRRLTRQARDDLVTAWLPDGSGLLGLTNRWSSVERGGYDVAVFDTATGLARPVTKSVEHEGNPALSTDGTRVAFIREPSDGPTLLCVTAFDGASEPECKAPAGLPVTQILGWSGPTELIITVDDADSRPLVRYNWQYNQITTLFGPYINRAQLSPDRHWVVAGVRVTGIEGIHDWIIPLERPTHARRVDEPADGPTRVRWWEGVPDHSQTIAHVEFTDTTHRILPGIATRLALRAFTAADVEVPLFTLVRWSSSDTLIATVDATGAVHPRKLGTVSITGSLAGWRSVSKRIEIAGEPVEQMFTESWDAEWQRRWIAFGEPQPIVIAGPDATRSLWTRGDGNFLSAAVQRESYAATGGLGVEIRMSTPLGDGNHQRARVTFASGLDTAAFRGADQRVAPPSVPRTDASCGLSFPAGDGRFYHRRVSVLGGVSPLLNLGARADSMASGRWWTLRLQILPDGRCGVAVNGQVVWLSTQPIPLTGRFRLWLGDSSLNARLLHGPLEVWKGVRTDIDWSHPE